MNGSTIAQRMADFLVQHAPFQLMDQADLLALAGAARVRFHEGGETVFSQGEERHTYIYVVHKGTVRLTQHTPAGETVHDLRGEGDLVGLGFFIGHANYQHSAFTDGETILYALKSEQLQRLLPKYPAVTRWLGVYFSLNPNYPPVRSLTDWVSPSTRRWLNESQVLPDWAGRTVGYCFKEETIRQAAQTMAHYGSKTLTVVDSDLLPIGLISVECLRDLLGNPEVSLDDPVDLHKTAPVPVMRDGLTVGDYILYMLENDEPYIVLTDDGTATGTVLRGLSHEDLLFAYGTDPVVLCLEMVHADNDDERHSLKRLRERAEAYIAAGLVERESLEWFARVNAAFYDTVAERCLALAKKRLLQLGIPLPERMTLAFAGRAARREYFGTSGIEWIVLTNDGYQSTLNQGVRQFIYEAIFNEMSRCGFTADRNSTTAPSQLWVQTLGEWRETFADWFGHSAQAGLLDHLAFLDLRAVAGDAPLITALMEYWQEALNNSPQVLRSVIGYALGFRPPLTLFRNNVIEGKGSRSTQLNLSTHVLTPVVNVARMLAFAHGDTSTTSTLERLRKTADAMADHRSVVDEAIEAFRLVFHLQARTILVDQCDGSRIIPSALPKLDQHMLKSAFRAIIALLEFVGDSFHVKVQPQDE
ncbi:MAG: putative nucleotidyltransferase substrate binding domain-containing protein [Verrucomicrobiota bacterium]|nr:putative nucleotidyltransferase substrate binding domain-containing protein [Verrucomicrobiota bacterium]